ncbi:ankyrin repeat and SOCS box protein 9-like [Chanos chanos]|uniref:Ankyrin repeat and SOCS box protein 9-like n=1 Tax=Chanos chanos TaxID=29144 RepID=A0A6J2WGF5_CHACN|nr:ankyrin repeat and SOCS box protein 9-like [Chanos chanos]
MTEQAEHRDTRTDQTRPARAAVYFSNPIMSDTESDWSPIHDAAYNGRLLSLHNLIGQGASVNLTTLDGVSPLHGACQQGHTGCVKLLIQHGANVNTSTVNWNTPLSEACAQGHLACVNLLLQQGASPSAAGNPAFPSPIHTAAARGHTDCVESLVRYGADIDQSSDQSGTPLFTACANQQLTTVRKLLDAGANVNRGKSGDSPLHIAARLPDPELVKTLLAHGADQTLRNAAGKRALDLAPLNSAVETLLGPREGPSPLLQLCRLSIRKTLGQDRLREIHSLSIPSELKQYLLYRSEPWTNMGDVDS